MATRNWDLFRIMVLCKSLPYSATWQVLSTKERNDEVPKHLTDMSVIVQKYYGQVQHNCFQSKGLLLLLPMVINIIFFKFELSSIQISLRFVF